MEKQEIKIMISSLRDEMNRSNNFMLGEINTPKPQNPKSVMSKLIVSELIDSSINQFNEKIEKYKFLQR